MVRRNWNCKIRALNYVNMEYAARRTYHIWCVRAYIHTFKHSNIQRKCTADMTSVGLAQARPNKHDEL